MSDISDALRDGIAEIERLRALLSEAEQNLHDCETRSEMHARSFANIVDEKEKIELLVKEARAKALEEAAKVAEDKAQAWSTSKGSEIDACLDTAAAIRALQSEER